MRKTGKTLFRLLLDNEKVSRKKLVCNMIVAHCGYIEDSESKHRFLGKLSEEYGKEAYPWRGHYSEMLYYHLKKGRIVSDKGMYSVTQNGRNYAYSQGVKPKFIIDWENSYNKIYGENK